MAYTYPNGDEVSVVDIVFLCHKWHGTLKRQESEGRKLGFFALDALPAPLHPVNAYAIEKLRALRQGK